MKDRSLLSFGSLSGTAAATIARAASDVGCSVEHVDTPVALDARLADDTALAVVLDLAESGAEDACLALRRSGRHGHVPILALSEECGDVPFLQLFQWGGDDIVADRPAALVRRLRALVSARAPEPLAPRDKPVVVVAGADARWRTSMGRALGNAGVDVVFATNAHDACAVARNARFVIADHALGPNGVSAAIDRARTAGIEAPWVVVAPPKRDGAVRRQRARVRAHARRSQRRAASVRNDGRVSRRGPRRSRRSRLLVQRQRRRHVRANARAAASGRRGVARAARAAHRSPRASHRTRRVVARVRAQRDGDGAAGLRRADHRRAWRRRRTVPRGLRCARRRDDGRDEDACELAEALFSRAVAACRRDRLKRAWARRLKRNAAPRIV
jgi:CheY-like chemotaxis protein